MFRQRKVTQPLQDGVDSQQCEEHYLVITPVIGQHEILSSTVLHHSPERSRSEHEVGIGGNRSLLER